MSAVERVRAAVLVAVVPLLLTGCGGEDLPDPRPKDLEGSSSCTTEGTVEAKPVPGLEAAVAPYRDPDDRFTITKQFGETAEVQLRPAGSGEVSATITLVRTDEGWVVTSVERC